MVQSIGLIILTGLFLGTIMQSIKLPRIIGYLAAGILLGPCCMNLIDKTTLAVSADIRKIALIIILVKAGLSLNIRDLKSVGRPALLMSFFPALIEISAYFIFAPLLLPVNSTEAAIMGSVLAAVSPAVVIPRMVHLIENNYGTKKSIPQMLLAGASCDDIFVIVLFSSFLSIAQGSAFSTKQILSVPLSIVTGIAAGIAAGYVTAFIFNFFSKINRSIRNSMKVVIILGISFLLVSAEKHLEGIIPFSGLLAVVSMSCTLKIKLKETNVKSLSSKFGKVWLPSEILLFVLVGAAVNIDYTMKAGTSAILLIFISLFFRSVAVIISMTGTSLNFKERIYCIIAYLPKATVQAAIGSVPLAIGLECGNLVLSVAVLGILITAPLGAIGMDLTYKHLLKKN